MFKQALSEGVSATHRAVRCGAVNFDLRTTDGNGGGEHDAIPNGVPDSVEMALIRAVLTERVDLSATGGVGHDQALAAYEQTWESASRDTTPLRRAYPTVAQLVTGYVMVGTQESFDAIDHMSSMFGAPLAGDYSLALGLGSFFGPQGDADGDGFTNREEYDAFIALGTRAYVGAALDPLRGPDAEQVAESRKAMNGQPVVRKRVGIVLYPGFEVLDVYGPVEMWSYVREFDLIFIAEEAGPVESAQGVATVAEHSFESAPALDVIMVPGGFGTTAQLENTVLLEFLRRRHEQAEFTTAVCTGSALLAKAGLLDGHRATSNKRFFSLAAEQSAAVEWQTDARWVEDGRLLTSSGVSAGTDMALALIAKLYGRERALGIASGVEYVWHADATDDPFAEFVNWPPEAGRARVEPELERPPREDGSR